MARKGRGVELYEVLAERAAGGKESSRREPAPPPTDEPSERATVRPPRSVTGREIIFGIDTAFVVFVSVLILIGTAFYMGHQRALEQSRRGLIEETGTPVPSADDLDVLKSIEGAERGGISIPQGKYTLQIFETAEADGKDLRLLAYDRAFVLNLEEVRREGVAEAHVFRKDGVLVLTVGLFDDESNPKLVRLREAFQQTVTGPPHRDEQPYRTCRIARVGELMGEALL